MQETPVLPNSNRPKTKWTSIVAIGAVASIIIAIVWGCAAGMQTGFGAETTYDPPGGDNTHFDPIAAADDIQAQIGESAELMGMSSTFVKSDGTQDLVTELYVATTNYEFVREVPTPDNAPPIGAGGSPDGKWYQVTDVDIFRPGQWRQVTGSSEYTYLHKGMALDPYDPRGSKPDTIPMPRCSFATLWERALQDGVPESAVAMIDYDADGYDFSISDLGYYAEFDVDCRYTGE